MAAIDLIGFTIWVQLGIQQVPPRYNPRRSNLSQQPASSAGGSYERN